MVDQIISAVGGFMCTYCGRFVSIRELEDGKAKVEGPEDPEDDSGYDCYHIMCRPKED